MPASEILARRVEHQRSRAYTHDVYGAGLSAMRQGSAWSYYLADGLGSTMAVVDASGAVQKSYQYDVYGEVTGGSGSLANEFDFAGQQTDPTGLQYLRARYYDPASGVFLSREPLAVGSSWTWNSLGYGGANPVRLIDPTGNRHVDSCEPDCDADRYVTIPNPGCPGHDCTFHKISAVFGPVRFQEDWLGKQNVSLSGPFPVGACYEHLGQEYREATYTYQSNGEPDVFLTVTVRERRSVFKAGFGAGWGPVSACPDATSWEIHAGEWDHIDVLSIKYERATR